MIVGGTASHYDAGIFQLHVEWQLYGEQNEFDHSVSTNSIHYVTSVLYDDNNYVLCDALYTSVKIIKNEIKM